MRERGGQSQLGKEVVADWSMGGACQAADLAPPTFIMPELQPRGLV